MPCRVPLCSSPFSCRIAALPTMPCVPAPFLFSCHRIATALPPHCHRRSGLLGACVCTICRMCWYHTLCTHNMYISMHWYPCTTCIHKVYIIRYICTFCVRTGRRGYRGSRAARSLRPPPGARQPTGALPPSPLLPPGPTTSPPTSPHMLATCQRTTEAIPRSSHTKRRAATCQSACRHDVASRQPRVPRGPPLRRRRPGCTGCSGCSPTAARPLSPPARSASPPSSPPASPR